MRRLSRSNVEYYDEARGGTINEIAEVLNKSTEVTDELYSRIVRDRAAMVRLDVEGAKACILMAKELRKAAKRLQNLGRGRRRMPEDRDDNSE